MAGNPKKGVSKIPVLRELCTNTRKSDQSVVTGKRSRFLSFLGRVSGDKSVGQSGCLQREPRREQQQEMSEGEAVKLGQKLESFQKENEYLKSKISKYEKLCSSLDHAFDDHRPSQKKEEEEEEEEEETLLNLFVENVILRAKQTLLSPKLQAASSTCPMRSPSTPTVSPPVCTQSTQTSVPMATPVCTQSTQTSVPMAPPVCTQTTQTSVLVTDTSVNTSLVEQDSSSDGTQPVHVSTNTSFEQTDTQDAETNTSVLVEPSGGAEVGGKKLEVALVTRALLQSSVEDLQTHVAYLESANASLRDELKGKDARLSNMGSQLLTMISKFEATDGKEQTQYRDLYHRSVQRCEALQSQVQRFGALFAKLQKINTLKEVVLSSVAQNLQLVESRYGEWRSERQEWKNKLETLSLKHAQLQEECEGVRCTSEAQQADHGALLVAHAQLLARHCIVRAVQTVESKEHQRTEKSVTKREAENAKLKRTLSKLGTALQRAKLEQQEALEFSEAERETLMEANTELESQLAAVRGQLGERDVALCTLREQLKAAEESVSELKEERSNARDLIIATSQEAGQLRSAVKEACSLLCTLIRDTQQLLPQGKSEEGSLSVDHAHLDGLESKELIGYLEGYMEETRASMASIKSTRKKEEEEERSVGCECCRRMREELESTHKMLNENGAKQYGTLLRENISLQEQVRELTAELSQGSQAYEKLTSYIQHYQANAMQKISVLKDNLRKTDTEVHELDKIVDQVREVLHSNISHVKQCKPLLLLLAELDGDEAPNQY